MNGRIFTLILFVFVGSLASASILSQIPSNSKPRNDLYAKIQKTTGVSLRQAYKAVFGKDKKAIYRLGRYSKLKGTRDIESGIQKAIKHHSQKCEKEKKKKEQLPCYRLVDGLKAQLKSIEDLRQKAKKDPKLGLYWSLSVMSHFVRQEILKKPYEKWEKECANQKQINTMKCKIQFLEVDLLHVIMRDLSQASYAKAQNGSYKEKRNELDQLIQRYDVKK